MFAAIQSKGLMECVVQAAGLLIGRIYSFCMILCFRIRGYDIDWSVLLAMSAALFQSRMHAISVGGGSRIGRNTRISAGFSGKLRIGKRVLVDDGSMIMAQEHITIGDDTQISAHCFVTDFNHRFAVREQLITSQGYIRKPVVIGRDVWIGANSVVLSGVHIGDGAVVGAGSVVTRDVGSYTVVAGNPAKILHRRS